MPRPAEAGSGGLGRHDLRVLLIPLACGLALRLLRLGHHGLFKDEGYSWAFSELGWSRMLPASIESFHPPLYYLVLKITRLVLPDTEVALRLPSVFFSLAGLLALGLTARALAGTRTAALAIWLGAISSFEICYAQDARMYTMLGFLWFLSAALLLWAWERPRVFVAWGVSAVLLAWTHLYGAVTASIELAIVVGWTLRRLRGKRPQRRGSMSERSEDGRSEPGWILAGSTLALVGVGMLGWNFRGHVAMEGGGGAWIPRLIDPGGLLALITVGLTAARGHFLDGSHLVPERLGSVPYGVWGVIGATLTLPAIFGWMRAVRGDGRMRRAAWISACVTTLPVAIAFIHARTQGLNTWAYKPFLGVAAMVYLWSAIGWMRWVEGPDTSSHSATKPGWRWLGVAKSGRLFGVATVLGAVALVSLVPYYARWERWPVADAYRSLPGTLVAGETLVLDAASQAWVAFFYLPAHAQRSQDRIWTTESGGGWVNRKDALAARVQPASCADLAAASPAGVRIIDAAKTDRRSADAIAGELSRCLAPPTPIRYWDEGGWRSYGAAGGGGPALGRATRFSGSSLPADPDPSRSQGGSGAGYVAGKDPELYSDTTLVVADTVQVTVPPTCL
ncbi:MAG: glycosyltransferase family 39 protein, partial [Candidatus Eisenbacteria bacterium]|nr:glycosyltransferase family 39 protein [Candidatus Eisenbacteria bacterium]